MTLIKNVARKRTPHCEETLWPHFSVDRYFRGHSEVIYLGAPVGGEGVAILVLRTSVSCCSPA